MVCRDFILPEICKSCLSFSSFLFAKNIIPDQSTLSAGRKIHQGYKVGDGFRQDWKEFKDIKGMRPDYVDFNTGTIYELKPMNPRGVRGGIRQLQKYNRMLGGGFKMRLELY